MRLRSIAAIFAISCLLAAEPWIFVSAEADQPAAKNEVKGQEQLTGIYAKFGVTYTLKNEFNFTLLSARYTLEPFIAYATLAARTDEKLLVLDIALKNSAKQDNWFNDEGFMSVEDEKGQRYSVGRFALMSKGANGDGITLKPGQGVGQPELNDPLQLACVVPAKARIVKIIINKGRAGKDEDVIRYRVAGAAKDEAGVEGDPANVITPLPDNVRDTTDKSGAVPLAEGNGKMGEYEPSGYFALRLESFAFSVDLLNGSPPDEGKRFAIATVTAKLITTSDDSITTVIGGDPSLYEIIDSDGERYKPAFFRKAKLDEDPDHAFKQGDEYTFRIVFIMPKDAAGKKLVLATNNSRKWAYDVSDMK